MHEREELDLDPTPSRSARWHYREPTNEKRSGRHVETELLCGTGIEDLRNIRLLHKAIMDNNGMEIIFQMLNRDALAAGDARNMFGCHV